MKSFSKAADAVHISQPTVSTHIKYLEDHYGTKLIDRLSKEAVPTKAGELLFGYAQRILALKEEADAAMAEFQGNIQGTLVLGGSNIPGVYLLPRIIGAFKESHPKVTISLSIADTEAIIQRILDGELELGLVGAVSRHRHLVQEKLIRDEMCLVTPASHPLARKKTVRMTDLLKEPFIVRQKGSGTLKSIQLSLKSGGYRLEQLDIVAEMGSTAAVIQGIKSGVGLSILSSIAVDDERMSGTLKALAIDDIDLKRSFYLTRHQLRSLSPAAKAFIEFLKHTFKT